MWLLMFSCLVLLFSKTCINTEIRTWFRFQPEVQKHLEHSKWSLIKSIKINPKINWKMSGCSWRPHLKLETKEDDQHCYIVVLILLQQLFYQRKLQLCQVFQVINLWEITKSSLKKKIYNHLMVICLNLFYSWIMGGGVNEKGIKNEGHFCCLICQKLF